MSKVLSHDTKEGTYVRNLTTGKVFEVVMDYPHKKVLQSARGTQVHVTPEFFKFWVEVLPIIDFGNGNSEVVYQ
jgi:hypothetical protein